MKQYYQDINIFEIKQREPWDDYNVFIVNVYKIFLLKYF